MSFETSFEDVKLAVGWATNVDWKWVFRPVDRRARSPIFERVRRMSRRLGWIEPPTEMWPAWHVRSQAPDVVRSTPVNSIVHQLVLPVYIESADISEANVENAGLISHGHIIKCAHSALTEVVQVWLGDWAAAQGTKGGGTKKGKAKLTGNCRSTVRHSGDSLKILPMHQKPYRSATQLNNARFHWFHVGQIFIFEHNNVDRWGSENLYLCL